MFDESRYDVLKIDVPVEGMNRNVSREALNQNFAYEIRNLFVNPLGEATLRYGTKLKYQLGDEVFGVIRSKSFVSKDGKNQILYYNKRFVKFDFVENISLDALGSVIVDGLTQDQQKFIKERLVVGSELKVEYNSNGIKTTKDYISDIAFGNDGDNYHVVVFLKNSSFKEEPEIEGSVFWSLGGLACDTNIDDPSSQMIRYEDNLSVACIPRFCEFGGKIYICNGLNFVVTWDGEKFDHAGQFLPETAKNFIKISDQSFSCVIDPLKFDISQYPETRDIELVLDGAPSPFKVQTATLAPDNTTLTIVVKGGTVPSLEGKRVSLNYFKFTPKFSFMYAAYDRVFALGEGVSGTQQRTLDQAMRVYFMYQPGSQARWFDERTALVPSMNISESHGVSDNLEAIAYYYGHLLFMGRRKTQAWVGTEPIGGVQAPNKPVMQLGFVLPVGIPHGDLVQEVANDVFAVTQTGLVSFSSNNVAKQLSINSYDAVNPDIRDRVKRIISDDVEYRSSLSFKYDTGSFLGFKIGFGDILACMFTSNIYGWAFLDGDFSKASSFCPYQNGLFLTIGQTVFKYGDGADGQEKSYGDNNGKNHILFLWSVPVVKFSQSVFMGLYYDLVARYTSSAALDKNGGVNVTITSSSPRGYTVFNEYQLPLQGDALSTMSLSELSYDDVEEDSIGFRFDQNNLIVRKKMKFKSSRFFVNISGGSKFGEFALKGINLYGTVRRR